MPSHYQSLLGFCLFLEYLYFYSFVICGSCDNMIRLCWGYRLPLFIYLLQRENCSLLISAAYESGCWPYGRQRYSILNKNGFINYALLYRLVMMCFCSGSAARLNEENLVTQPSYQVRHHSLTQVSLILDVHYNTTHLCPAEIRTFKTGTIKPLKHTTYSY